MTRKGGVIGSLVVAGLAAAGYLAYTKMSPDAKRSLAAKGRKLADNLSLDNLKGSMAKVTGA